MNKTAAEHIKLNLYFRNEEFGSMWITKKIFMPNN